MSFEVEGVEVMEEVDIFDIIYSCSSNRNSIDENIVLTEAGVVE